MVQIENHPAGLPPSEPMLTATGPQGQTRSGKLTSSSRRDPCPICGRTHDTSCRIGAEMVLCWRGSTFAPPTWAQRKGDHGPGADGETWAYLGDRDGWALFRPHRPLGQQERRRLPRRPLVERHRWADGGTVQAFWMNEPRSGRYRPSDWIVASLYLDHCLAMGWQVAL